MRKGACGMSWKEHEVVMDGKTHSGAYQAAVILVPPPSRVSSILKIKLARRR